MRRNHLIRRTASMALLAALAYGGTAFAQDDDNDPSTVGELIVTAQKREQNLQDVPVVVTVATEEALEAAGVKDIKDLTILTPGLMVTSTSNETVTTARIRGIGTVGDNPGLESSVSVVIDGIYRPRNGVGFGDLGELERVEVLKGPQGTLFGKNASSGVINILTKEPSFTYGHEVELTGGNYNHRGGSIAVTGPLIEDQLAGRLFFAMRERDGFLNVTPTPPRTTTKDNDQNYYTARGQLLWTPGDTVSVRAIADYSRRDEHCCLAVQINNNAVFNAAINALTPFGGVMVPADPFRRQAFSNRETNQIIDDKGLSAEVNWDTPWLDGATLTSITGLREWSTVNGQDSDFSGGDILYRDPDGSFGTEFNQLSQEVRLAGANGNLNWLIGGFFANERLDSNQTILFGTQLDRYISTLLSTLSGGLVPNLSTFTGLPVGGNFSAGSGQSDSYRQKSSSFAVFTNNSYAFTDSLELTVGLRYTVEDKELEVRYNNIGGTQACANLQTNSAFIPASLQPLLFGFVCAAGGTPGFAGLTTDQKRSEENVSGTVKLAYRWTEDLMTYASYARGYKAGGFNLDRSRCGSGTRLANTACPGSVYADPATGLSPLRGFNPISDTSFPEETVDSFELGAKTTWGANLLLNGAVFYQKFEGFQLNTFTGLSFIVASIPEVTSAGVDFDFIYFTPIDGLDISGGVSHTNTQYADFVPGPGVSANLPNNRMSFAPEYSVALAVNYEREFAQDMLMKANVSARYNTEYNTGSDLNPEKLQDEYTLVNARLGVGPRDERWALELWGQNVFDQDYYQVVFDATFQSTQKDAFLGAPRTFGVTLRFKQ